MLPVEWWPKCVLSLRIFPSYLTKNLFRSRLKKSDTSFLYIKIKTYIKSMRGYLFRIRNCPLLGVGIVHTAPSTDPQQAHQWCSPVSAHLPQSPEPGRERALQPRGRPPLAALCRKPSSQMQSRSRGNNFGKSVCLSMNELWCLVSLPHPLRPHC